MKPPASAIPTLPRCVNWSVILALGLAAAGCATGPSAKVIDPSLAGVKVPTPYMRVARPTNGVAELQIAVRKFERRRGSGPAIWLAGASHIGETNYYAALQRHLDAQALVLYEGIKGLIRPPNPNPNAAPAPLAKTETPAREASSGASAGGSLQDNMARSLGLAFQMNAIAYDRSHFQNSDLSAEQIQALMIAGLAPPTKSQASAGGRAAPRSRSVPRDQPLATASDEREETGFDKLADTMSGTSLWGALANVIFEFVGSSPRLQSLTKLAMIELLGGLEDDLGQIQALPPEMQKLLTVLIQERNKAVVADLQTQLRSARPPASISVFYGAGHLADLEKRLRQELGYVPVDQLWLPVFSVDTARAGLSNFEISLVRSVVGSQLQAIRCASKR